MMRETINLNYHKFRDQGKRNIFAARKLSDCFKSLWDMEREIFSNIATNMRGKPSCYVPGVFLGEGGQGSVRTGKIIYQVFINIILYR